MDILDVIKHFLVRQKQIDTTHYNREGGARILDDSIVYIQVIGSFYELL